MIQCDFLVIGAGIAGASAASELARSGTVVLLEREAAPGYHTTGRSAALFTETYGNDTVRALTIGSRPYFTDSPGPDGEAPMLTPRKTLFIARADQRESMEEEHRAARALIDGVRKLDGGEIVSLVPVVRRDYVDCGLLETGAMDMNVDRIHQSFLGALKARGGEVHTDAEVLALRRNGSDWRAETQTGDFTAAIIVNAAGAWADEIADLAGIPSVGLTPMRRTVITFAPPQGMDTAGWPAVIDVDEQFYFKPDAGLILASPADETPQPPADAQPEEMDIAVAIDRLQRATAFDISRLHARWAGLRTFAPDRTPVVGMEPGHGGFFWLAGQGGYGIMTSPAMARCAAGLIAGAGIPEDLQKLGVGPESLAPARFRT